MSWLNRVNDWYWASERHALAVMIAADGVAWGSVLLLMRNAGAPWAPAITMANLAAVLVNMVFIGYHSWKLSGR